MNEKTITLKEVCSLNLKKAEREGDRVFVIIEGEKRYIRCDKCNNTHFNFNGLIECNNPECYHRCIFPIHIEDSNEE